MGVVVSLAVVAEAAGVVAGRRMHPLRRLATFTDKYPLVGPQFWSVSVQYVLVQLAVAAAWTSPTYSWKHNAISDLGATLCGTFHGRAVCSPDNANMNASFIILGITMMLGSILIYHEFTKTKLSRLGFSMMATAGFGTLLVGLFPENVSPTMHSIGALLAFLIGDSALIILGLGLRLSRVMKWYSIISGVVSLLALALYLTHHYLGLGLGGMERLAGYPQTAWLIIFGVYMTTNHYRNKRINTNLR